MRASTLVLGFLVVVLVAAGISFALEYATNSILLMVIVFSVLVIAGGAGLVKLYLRQDDLNY